MSGLTLLSEDQVKGKGKLRIIKKYGLFATATDFFCMDYKYYYYTSTIKDGRVVTIYNSNFHNYFDIVNVAPDNSMGVRPVIDYNLISSQCKVIEKVNKHILIVEYGSYPQDYVGGDYEELLNDALSKNKVKLTNNFYTFNKLVDRECKRSKLQEYEFEGHRFVKDIDSTGDNVWYEVQNISWIVDLNSNVALSKNILFSGVEFNYQTRYDFKFEDSTLKKYLDDVFYEEITQMYKTDIKTTQKTLTPISNISNVSDTSWIYVKF